MSRYRIDPYLFSDQEKMVLKSLLSVNTPLKISRQLNLPRSTVYFILEKLKTRGLVKNERKGKKLFWSLKKDDDFDPVVSSGFGNGLVKIYDDEKTIIEFLESLSAGNDVRFKGFNGDYISKGWKDHVGREKIIYFNKKLKTNGLVSDLIASEEYLKGQIKDLGDDWAESFKQKPTEFHYIDASYVSHGAQIFFKKDRIWLINISKPLVVEIKDLEMVKMFSQMFDFLKDHTKKINLSEQI